MDEKHVRQLEEMLKSAPLTDWEQKAFADIHERCPPALSFKQRSIIERAYAKYISGEDPHDYEPPTKYERCLWEVTGQGGFIFMHNTPIGPAVTKQEAYGILRWLNESVDEIVQIEKEAAEEGATPEEERQKPRKRPKPTAPVPTEPDDDGVPF